MNTLATITSLFDSESSRIIETATTTENLRRLSQAVALESPILVQGEVGCGKSFLIRELAASMGLESTLVELHLDDQTDSKTLLGAYVCSDVPGEFLWQAGVITQAALNGRWLVIEDIDRAPLEVAASLSTLLERRRLYLPDRGKEVAVHPSFRVFGTRSIATGANGVATAGAAGLINVPSLRHFSYFWHFVSIDVPSHAEIKHVVTTKFPSLLPIVVQKLFETYGLFSRNKKSKLSHRRSRNTDEDKRIELDLENEDGTFGAGTASMMTTRLFTLRDLMKVAHRCTSHSSEFNRASGVLTEELRRHLLYEVIDVFAAAVRDKERERGVYNELVLCLGRCWGVPECDIDGLILNAHPQLHRSDDSHRLENESSSIRHSTDSNRDDSANGFVTVGRVTILSSAVTDVSAVVQQFAFNRHSLRMLERLAACVSMDEPVLLVGETGSGKTTSVQELANMTRRKLVVQNLSLSTDASDLFGGFRPVSLRQLFLPCYEQFLALFQETFSSSQNSEFVLVVAQTFRKQQWKKMLKAFLKAAANALQKLGQQTEPRSSICEGLMKNWTDFSDRSARFETNLSRIEVGFAFAFVDGLLVEAMRKGHWVLLDEINLAASETLQALAGVLDGQSLCLTEKGDVEPVPRHKDFRIFAAMNPPTDVGKKELPIALRSRFTELYAEEVTDPQDLRHVVARVLADSSIPTSDEKQIDDIVSVYLGCRATAEMTLADGAGQRPRFSLRSLTRSLKAAKGFIDIGLRPLNRALFEGFLLNFHTLLASSCRAFMWTFLKKSLGVEGGKKELSLPPSRPGGKKLKACDWVLVKPFWLRTGGKSPSDWAEKDSMGITRFVLTPTVESAVRDLAAAVAAGVAPILLQGPTSVGKTSMIEYLAARTGHKCVRINNHEHTDVQEYVGGYVTNDRGHLEFRDGLLVDALRNGHWIILDELNLAPSDVLEALNRLLDDNKELLIPETGETVRPQAGFSLFATQNPPGAYGGRKPLSRAFRNRFLELNISDLPSAEIQEIVTQSCGIAPKFAKMMVAVMLELQTRRQQSSLFQGKYGAVTTRDLIKWGRRQPQSALEVAEEGYMLLAEKLRSEDEKKGVEEVLNNVCKVKILTDMLYEYPPVQEVKVVQKSTNLLSSGPGPSSVTGGDLNDLRNLQEQLRAGEVQVEGVKGVAITASLRRMWRLTGRCVAHNEPVLLIGETGCGKTMGCQLLATHRGQRIRILNCHQSTETSDIIGGLRPVRGRAQLLAQALQTLESALLTLQTAGSEGGNEGRNALLDEAALRFLANVRGVVPNGTGDNTVDENQVKIALDLLSNFVKEGTTILSPPVSEGKEDTSPVPLKKAKRNSGPPPVAAVSEGLAEDIELISALSSQLQVAEGFWHRSKALFEWQDGPLVTAMKEGDMFVLDEINLAEDAVIERLNSVLESGREITLAEKGGLTVSSEKIVAHPNFKFLATMNPGGDFGKRELSPALRSRFTEMWIPSANSSTDISLIVAEILQLEDSCGTTSAELSGAMVRFMQWLNTQSSLLTVKGLQISVREVLAWAKFVSSWRPQTMGEAYSGLLHGAHMVLLDGLGIGLSTPRDIIRELKRRAVHRLLDECHVSVRDEVYRSVYPQESVHNNPLKPGASSEAAVTPDGKFTLGGVGFSIPMGPNYCIEKGISTKTSYILTARSVTENMRRILRAMQLPRPILLEGPPGVGKTSLIANLAKLTGHNLVRINLSEHSEISDLLGSDLPAPIDYSQDKEGEEPSAGKNTSSSGPKFVWCDGVFLTALKRGDWVLLDELNLAPQSVLEGLNACLDHRGEVFLPEIGQSFFCPPSFRVFCAQNPAGEGGGRKGLPQSFLTRFSRVFVEEMDERDVREIAMQAYSQSSGDVSAPNADSVTTKSTESDQQIVSKASAAVSTNSLVLHFLPQMVQFTRRLQSDIVDQRLYGNAGSPWEFNLRDIFRWCELVQSNSKARVQGPSEQIYAVTAEDRYILADAAYMLFFSRLRTRADREGASKAFSDVFGWTPLPDHSPSVQTVGDSLLIGMALLPRTFLSSRGSGRGGLGFNGEEGPDGYRSNPLLLAGLGKVTETLAHCVSLRWPALLIGPSGSGKRRCLRQLALSTGTALVEFPATASTDSTELLGSFEQASAYRHLRFGLEHLEQAAAPLFSLFSDARDQSSVTVAVAERTLALLLKTQNEAEQVVVTASLRLKAGGDLFASLLSTLQAVAEAISSLCEDPSLQSIVRNIRVEDVLSSLAESRACFDKCYFDCNFVPTSGVGGGGVSGFEWVDGVVVQAVKSGHWLLIDNVNLCSASVLDRLNSLLEPGGTLLLTESGAGTILTPHPDFRVFFSMDPSHGEISRAMRNRCVEISLLVEGDGEVAAAYVLSQVRTSSAPLLPSSTDPSSVRSEALLAPLCSVYEALAATEIADPDSVEAETLWDLRGSLITSGISASTFPRFRMFARLLRLVAIEAEGGLGPRKALECGLRSVLPFFALEERVADEGDIEKRVRNMSVDDDSAVYPHTPAIVKSPLQLVLSSPLMSCVSADIRASLVLLVMLTGTQEGGRAGAGWLQTASRSVRDRAARDLSAFSFEVDANGLAVKLKGSSSDAAKERARLDSGGTAAFTALHILAEMESDTSTADVGTLTFLLSFTMSLLVRSAMSSTDSTKQAVSALLIEAGCPTQAASFEHWVGVSSGSAQMAPLSTSLVSGIIGGGEGADNVLTMLQGGRSSTAATLGATVASSTLGTSNTLSRDALAFGATCSQLMDVAIFDRWLALDSERAQREEVDCATSLSSDSSLSSLFALAYALHKRRIVADSTELQVLLSVHAALLVTDVVLAKVTEDLSASSPLVRGTSPSALLSTQTMGCLKDLLNRRDMLSRVLCSSTAPAHGGGSVRMPWEDVIVCVRWIKKATSALMTSVKRSLDTTQLRREAEGDVFLKICASAHVELSKFDRALGEYWNRPVLLDTANSASASSKLRLWKEGGHAAVPPREEEWRTLQALRQIVQPIHRALPSFVDTQLETVPVACVGSECTPTMRREWLCLYSTFYWMHTNESASGSDGIQGPISSSQSVDVRALTDALQAQFDLSIGAHTAPVATVMETNSSSNDDVYGEADYPLLADKEAADKVRQEWKQAGELSASILLEPSVIASLFGVSNTLAAFLRHHSIRILTAAVGATTTMTSSTPVHSRRVSKIELLNLSSQLSSIICLAVRYTLFDLGDFRELQTLLWSVEAVLALIAECSSTAIVPKKNNKKLPEKGRAIGLDVALLSAEDTLLSLARVFCVQFEVRLQSLLSRNLVGCMDAVAFSYSSPTLRAILEPSLEEGHTQGGLESLISSSVHVPWSWALSTGVVRLLQPSGLETALRHVDARALYSHSIAGAGTVSQLTGGGAVVTVATCGNALARLLQLFRLSVAAATPASAPTLIMRLELLEQHTVEVLSSIRDFLTPQGFSAVAQAALAAQTGPSNPCALYQQLLDLHISDYSHSVYVSDLLTRCLDPVLTVLADQNIRSTPLAYVPSVGVAWVQMGLLRLYLTLPQTPVDPATKSAVKARLLSTELQLSKRQMQAIHLQAVLSAKPPVTLDMAATAIAVRQSERQVAALSARAVQRPSDAPLFEELFSELRGACDGLADINRIFELVTRTTEAFSVMQQACQLWVDAMRAINTVSKGKASKDPAAAAERAKTNATAAFDTLTGCAREELGWQGSVAAFSDRCLARFSAYEDVTSPVLAALHNLSSGMRLCVGWCFGQGEDLILALAHTQVSSRRPSGLLEKSGGNFTASSVLAKGWMDVLVYPHSSSIRLSSSTGDQVSCAAISQVHSLLQCSDFLAARAFKSISDMRTAQGELPTRTLTRVAPNPLLVDKICPQAALLQSLARLDYLIGGGTADCSSAKGLFRQVLERFVHAYLRAEDDRKKQAALKAALYQNKAEEKVFESDDAKEELVALRLHFPDHLSDFRDITDTAKGPDGETISQLRDEDDEDIEKEKAFEEKDKEAEESELTLSVDPQTAALLIGYHCRMVFLHTTRQLESGGMLWVNSAQRLSSKVHVGQREALDSALTSCSLMTAKGLEWGLRRLLSPGLDGKLRGGSMNALSFMAEKCNSSSWGTRPPNACASWLERLSGVEATEGQKKGKGKRRKGKAAAAESAAMAAVGSIDRDLLLLLDASAEGPWHPKDFNADPHPEEVMLAAEPLRKLFDRATEVLQLYPGNELLVQVCKVAARISELHTSTPVGKLLLTVQLLLVKAQEWEQFAAKHVSLHVEMAGLSVLIGRWRELELKSWGQLLRCKEQTYVQTAMTYWFSLARSLNSSPEISESSTKLPESSTKLPESSTKVEESERRRREAWPGLADVAPGWLCAGFISQEEEGGLESLFDSAVDAPEEPVVKADALDFVTPKIPDAIDPKTGSIYGDADGALAHKKVFAKKFLNVVPKGEKMTETSYLLNIFDILNSFLKRSVVGEFPTRVHLVRLFALQLHQDTMTETSDLSKTFDSEDVDAPNTGLSPPAMSISLRKQLARIVMGVWRYYQQFLPAVRRFQDLLRDPIERRLKGEVKIGKWDQLSTYGLIEHSERVHKKLNKFIREYQGDVLEYPLSAVLKRDLIGDLASEQGDLKASTAVPPASSVFPMLKGMGESQHLYTASAPAKRAAPSSQIERQKAHEESIHAMVVEEQAVEELNGDRQFKKDEEAEEEEEEEVEVDYVADCAEELLAVSSSAPRTHTVTPSDTQREFMIQELLSLSVVTDFQESLTQGSPVEAVKVADTYPKLLRWTLLCRKMDEYLRNTLIMRVASNMTRAERKEKDPSFFLMSARYQGKARFGLQGAELAEGLCEDIFNRIESLRAEGVPKSAKQRAVWDLLRKMREEGVSHLKSLVPLEIRQSVQLLSVPPPLAGETASDLFWSSASGSASSSNSNDVFQKAETYFTRSIAELDQLRVQAVAPSAQDISSREATLMVATAENLFCSALRLRCAVGAGLQNRRASLNALQRLHDLSTPTPQSSGLSGGGVTAGSALVLKAERKDYTVRAGSVVLDILVQLRKLLRTAGTAHQPEHLEDSPSTATAAIGATYAQQTAQAVGRAIAMIDGLVAGALRGEAATPLVASGKKSESNLSLYDALAVAEQDKKDAVWYASFGSFHLPPSPTSNTSQSESAVLADKAAAALRELEGVKDGLFALLSSDVATPVITRLQEYADTLLSFSSAPCVGSDEQSGAVQIESRSVRSLSAVVDESLITVQRIRAIAERTGRYKMPVTPSSSAKITGCFGESAMLTNATSEDKGDKEETKEKGEMRLVDLLSLGMTSFSALQTHKLTSQLSALCENLSELPHTSSQVGAHTRLLVQQTACPLVAKVLGAEAVLLRDLCESYKSCGKLLYVLLRVFRVLLAKGLCSDETKESEGGGGEGERRFEDDVEGTGMGEGDGKKDVSDQIDNEEQLLGLKDDTPKEDKGEQKQESKELSEEEKDKGVEMSQDFEGDMFDIPEETDPDNKDDDQEDDEEELDREMGDANAEDIVDEKQWDREEDGDGPEDNGEEKEKFEEGSKMEGEKLDGETRTREDKEDGDKQKDKEKDKAEGGNSDEKDEEEDEDRGGEGEDDANESKINEDNEEDTTDKPLGVDVRKEEKPVEENEEGGEMEEQEGEQGEGGEGEEQPQNEPTEGEDLPDDMNLDGGSDDGKEGEEGADQDMPEGEGEGNEDTPMDIECEDQDPSDKMPEEEEKEEDSDAMQASGGGNIPQPDQEEEEAAENTPEGEEAKEGTPADSNGDDNKYTAPAFGVKAQGGKDSVLGTEEDEEGPGGSDDKDGEDEDAGKDDPSTSQGKSGSKGSEGASQGRGQEGEVHETSGGQRQEGDPQSKQRERDPPNPFKQRGDVNKAWHRRLNLVAPEQEEEDEKQGMANADDPIDEESGGQGLYEHDKEGGGTEQVLADVAEDEAVQVPQAGEQSNEQRGGEEEDTAMDREGEQQDKPRKDERKRDREKKDEKEESLESEEAKRLRKKMKQEHDKQRKQRQLEEGGSEGEDEGQDSDIAEDVDGASGPSAEKDEKEKQLEGEMDVNDIGGKVYTNSREKESTAEDAEEDGVEGREDFKVDSEMVGGMVATSARLQWSKHRATTESHAMRLCEQLRLVLEPTLATRLQGDYRTGKRINMRRVVGYVASGFRKDKIWLRRTKPAKREYQVMVMIDNSSSMGEAGPIALSALATISTALTRLEVGQLCVAAFASGVQLVHPFGQPFDDEAGARAMEHFTFEAERTLLGASLEAVAPVFSEAKAGTSAGSGSGSVVLQLCFVISDARIDSDNRSRLDSVVRSFAEQNVLVVLIVIDKNLDPKDSIFNTRTVEFKGDKVVTSAYLDDFPFPYYVAIQRLEALPEVLSDALKQWFQIVGDQLSAAASSK